VTEPQRIVCEHYGVRAVPSPPGSKVGISRTVLSGLSPVNGLRHRPVGDTNGWYIWAGGEPGQDPDFFIPLHVEHLEEWCPEVLPFLALPPGSRFLLADGHEDVWHDAGLLDSR
jgi:hypothetical protein